MQLLMKKSMEDLMAISMERLAKTPINEVSKGGVARLFLAVINENTAGFYEALEVNHLRAFLSTADDEGLDAIGYTLSCPRNSGEDTEAYRFRISQQCLSLASSNETAVRLAVLSVPDVQDVVMKRYTMGTGSFSIFVVTATAITPPETIKAIEAAVDKAVGYGIKFNVSAAGYVPVEIKVKLMFSSSTDLATQQAAKTQVTTALRDYLNSRSIGEPLIINEITQRIMDVSEDIINYQLYELYVNGKRVLNKDQNCKWNERFCESPKPNAIVVS